MTRAIARYLAFTRVTWAILLSEGLTPSRVCLAKLAASAHLRLLSANTSKHSSGRVYAREPQQDWCINFQRKCRFLHSLAQFMSPSKEQRARRRPGPAAGRESPGMQSRPPGVQVPSRGRPGRAGGSAGGSQAHGLHATPPHSRGSFPTSKLETVAAPTSQDCLED